MPQFIFNRRQFLAWSASVSASSQIAWAAPEHAEAHLLKRAIPASGERIPCVGIGTNKWISNDNAQEQAILRETLEKFFALGGRVIDTAPVYRSSETALGNLIAELGINDAFYLATKIDRQQPDEALEQMQRSKRYLRTNKLDLLQVHNLRGATDLLNSMFEWRDAGHIRYVGITTSRISQFTEMEQLMRDFPLDFVQLNYSLVERDAEQRLLPLAQDRNIAVMVNRPFARAKFFSVTKGNDLPAWATEFDCDSWAQFALKFVLAQPAVTCVIPGMSTPRHVADNLNAGSGKLPTTDQRARQINTFAQLTTN
jgi:aryl-alcohol dehydrogenase-like predicted oxidoreductase